MKYILLFFVFFSVSQSFAAISYPAIEVLEMSNRVGQLLEDLNQFQNSVELGKIAKSCKQIGRAEADEMALRSSSAKINTFLVGVITSRQAPPQWLIDLEKVTEAEPSLGTSIAVIAAVCESDAVVFDKGKIGHAIVLVNQFLKNLQPYIDRAVDDLLNQSRRF